MTQLRPASVAVLAGGKSSRMGSDKALTRLLPGDPPLLQIALERVCPLSDDVFVVASNRPEYGQFGAPVHADLYPDAGALGGIGSALRYARHDRCLIVSCDHPFLNAELLRTMLNNSGDWDALVPVLPGESRQGGAMIRQTLHAVYTRRCLPAIEWELRQGRLQTVGFLSEVRVEELEIDELSRHDPELRSFFSVNTPEALQIARRWRTDLRNL